MRVFVLIAAFLAFVLGLLLFVAPKTLVRATELMERQIRTEDFIFGRRLIFGAVLVVLGVATIYFLYWG